MLLEEKDRLFIDCSDNPHMTSAYSLKPEAILALPAIAHVDGTARPQFVTRERDLQMYEFLSLIKRETGYGVVLNTSFNIHGRPIVMTPRDAIDDFFACSIDVLYLGKYRLTRKYL